MGQSAKQKANLEILSNLLAQHPQGLGPWGMDCLVTLLCTLIPDLHENLKSRGLSTIGE